MHVLSLYNQGQADSCSLDTVFSTHYNKLAAYVVWNEFLDLLLRMLMNSSNTHTQNEAHYWKLLRL